MAVDGVALGLIFAGGLIGYAGIKGVSIPSELQKIIQGQSPAGAAKANPIVATSTNPGAVTQVGGGNTGLPYGTVGSASSAANRALGKLMAAPYGWATGQEWQALDYGWGTLESGWNNQIYNGGTVGGPYQPGLAYGIPQANGHGSGGAPYPDGNPGNPPGAGGDSSPTAQIAWGLQYIKATYGSPSNVPGWLGQGGYVGY